MGAAELIDRYAGQLASAVSDTAPEAWRILVHGAAVDGWIAAVQTVLAAVFLCMAVQVSVTSFHEAIEDPSNSFSPVVAGVMPFVAVFLAICVLVNTDDAARGIFAPEREALREVMRVAK